MTDPWFKKVGLLYQPISPAGVLVTVAAIAFMVPVVVAAVRTAHSKSDCLYELFVYATCTAFWWKWIAERTS